MVTILAADVSRTNQGSLSGVQRSYNTRANA